MLMFTPARLLWGVGVLVLVLVLGSSYAHARPTATINVMDHGAVGDGVHNDTAAIRKALDLAEAHVGQGGSAVVLLPSPRVFLSGPLHMRSHTTFRVEVGATLLGSPYYDDYEYELVPGQLVTDATMPSRKGGSKSRQSLIAGARCATTNANGSHCVDWGRLTNVTLDGGGTIDGQGQAWWIAKDAGCAHPRLLPFGVACCS